MGDDDGKEEPPVPEWEVVSMTESTYAAAPNSSNAVGHDRAETSCATGLKKDEMADYGTSNTLGKVAAETSPSMFAFGDFVFPPSQHENLPLEPEVLSEYENEDANEVEDFGSNFVVDGGIRMELEHQNQINIKGYHFPVFDAKGNLLSVGETELAEHDALLRPAQLRSSRSELCGSAPAESSVIDEVTESNNQDSDSSISNLPKHTDKDDDACNLPCGAWWNRRVASLYAQTKEANGFCSICVAAAILGLLILGQQWQQERWQLLQLKWQSSLFDEKMGRMLGPLTRFKDMLIGGHRRGSLISSTDS